MATISNSAVFGCYLFPFTLIISANKRRLRRYMKHYGAGHQLRLINKNTLTSHQRYEAEHGPATLIDIDSGIRVPFNAW